MCPATSFLELTDSEFRASYRIGSRIGAGGLGEVFLATQISLDRKVVVKLLRREVTSDRTNLLRFEREALILSRLSHPRLVRVYEYGLWNGKPFMIQEYVEGGSLADLLGKTRRLDIEETIQFGRQVGEGLQFLHEKGILHRDIKPANILLTRSREAKIGDFGLVRQEGDEALTGDGLVGTLNYIAPEAVRSGDFSARSDLYALGLVLYRSLTGQLPFDGVAADAAKLMAMRFNDPPPPLERHRQDVPAALAGLVNRLINQDPDIRPATAREVNQALEQITASPDRGPQRIGGRTQELIPVLQPGPPPRGQATSVLAGQVAPRPPSQPWVTIVLIVGVISTAMPLGVLYLRPYFSGSQASYRMVNHELRYSGQAVLFTYTTSRPCPTVVEVARGDGEPSRFPSVPTAPTTSHSVKITGLADGASLKVAALFPDGSRSIRLLARSPSLDNATVWAERTARAVRIGVRTERPARLAVQIVRAGEGAAGSTAAVLEAHTGEAIEHELRLGPLDPRTDYDMRSRLSTADGVTKSLRGVAIPSPLRELQSLAMDVRAQDYAAAMTKIEMSRANSSEKATLPPITRLLDRINYRSRAKLLSKQHTDIYGEGRLTVEERWNLYDSLGGLRHVDRYCQVYGLDLRTEVENLVSPDLRWSDAPLVSAPSTSITTRLAAGTILIPQDIDESLGLVKPDVQVPVAVPVTLLVPRSLDPGEAQISVTVSNLHSQALLIERAKDQRTLLLVPPARYAYTSTVLTLYHGWPREWSLPGKLTLNVRVVTMPGFYRNPKADAVKISLTNMKQSCLNLRDLSLALR